MDDGGNYGIFRVKLRKSAGFATGFAPAAGATVQASLGDAVAATAYTDANGTADISLPSADCRTSQISSPASLPYTVYDIKVSLAGYIPVLIKRAQVYPGVVTVMKRDMERTVDQPKKRADVTIVPPHKLSVGAPPHKMTSGNPPHKLSALKHLPVSRAKLPDVIIPETITVHLGAPLSDAENVTVPFLDYIKNTAASELCPIWREAALRANIIARVTFALSRVHTGWYRARGLDFDITSLPEYDMTYIRGQPTFDITDRLTDGLFGVYMAEIGRTEPVFAFSDGKRINGGLRLSEWGTWELADQYYTPIEILACYFGENIRLMTAKTGGTADKSLSGDMAMGDESPEVASLQHRLNRIAVEVDYTEIPFIAVDGRYGGATAEAVKVFQTIFGLPPSGAADEVTRDRIAYIYKTVKRPAQPESEASRRRGADCPGYILKIGDRGSDVLKIQCYLEKLSPYIYNSRLPQLTADGVFDAVLREYVLAFQDYCGITPSGCVDEETRNAVAAAYCDIPKDRSPETAPYPGTPVRYGDSGAAVKYIQRALNAVGGGITAIPRLAEDGVYGDLTAGAVKAFQKYYGLAADGIAGPLTWARLAAEFDGIGEPAGQNISR